MRISYSAMDTYKSCPLKYKYKNIDKLKEPKSKEAVFGTLIHSTLKYIHTADGALFPTLDAALDHFSKNWNSEIYEIEAEERAAFTQGVKIIQNYFAKNTPADFTIVDLESFFSIDIGSEDDPHTVSGIIDRIDRTENGYEIIDYKTSKKLPSQQYIDENLQLSIYLLAFLKRYPRQIDNLANITVSLYFLKHGEKLSATRTKEQLDAVEEEFLAVIADITAQKFEPTVTPLCGWCGFQKICPMWKHKFKEEITIDDTEVRDAIEEYFAIKNKHSADRKRVAQLQEKITTYMQQNDVERVFGKHAVAAQSERKTYKYDVQKLKELLEPKGLWDDVIKVDGTALNQITKDLSADVQKELNATREEKISRSLTIKKTD